ncbi:MAG: hypothetical protein Q8Q23_03100 [bacterium]|nr:hypothetical protein [bacterium]
MNKKYLKPIFIYAFFIIVIFGTYYYVYIPKLRSIDGDDQYRIKNMDGSVETYLGLPNLPPDSFIKLLVVNKWGWPIKEGKLHICYEYEPPWQEYDYCAEGPYDLDLTNGLVPLDSGASRFNPTITIWAENNEGNTSDTIQFREADYREWMKNPASSTYVFEHKFKIDSAKDNIIENLDEF